MTKCTKAVPKLIGGLTVDEHGNQIVQAGRELHLVPGIAGAAEPQGLFGRLKKRRQEQQVAQLVRDAELDLLQHRIAESVQAHKTCATTARRRIELACQSCLSEAVRAYLLSNQAGVDRAVCEASHQLADTLTEIEADKGQPTEIQDVRQRLAVKNFNKLIATLESMANLPNIIS